MQTSLSLLLAQLNPTVGDLEHSVALATEMLAQGQALGADVVVLPELFLCGYPPEDLLLKSAFIDDCQGALMRLMHATKPNSDKRRPALLVGLPWRHRTPAQTTELMNAVALLEDGELRGLTFKHELPNYGVFDEKRHFTAGPLPKPLLVRGFPLGVMICEDAWFPAVSEHLVANGAKALISLNASPYERGKPEQRLKVIHERVNETGVPYLYLNMVGGQDELVFDGASFALNAAGKKQWQAPHFEEHVALITLHEDEHGKAHIAHAPINIDWQDTTGQDHTAQDYTAIMLGLRDYVNKNRFPGVVLGLSGGIDSALVAVLAVDALGPERVRVVGLPSRYSSDHSLSDARKLAERLGLTFEVLPIEEGFKALEAILSTVFTGCKADLTEENLQSRLRGTLLMALSNKFGPMVLTTGNKSEMAVGYATLYGDMNGGFNPIKDIYKTEVYRLCALRNRWKPAIGLGPDGTVIHEALLTKAPSAELRPNQTDQDSLPPYDVLDGILQGLIEREASLASLVLEGFEEAMVQRVQNLLMRAEYKRRQAAPGVKISPRNFGRDRRYPITHGYRDV